MRLDEFQTSSRKDWLGLSLKAWARYKRGDIPEHGEVDYIMRRVKDAHPKAELVAMKRTFVPVSKGENNNTEVWWEFEWVVYGKEGGAE